MVQAWRSWVLSSSGSGGSDSELWLSVYGDILWDILWRYIPLVIVDVPRERNEVDIYLVISEEWSFPSTWWITKDWTTEIQQAKKQVAFEQQDMNTDWPEGLDAENTDNADQSDQTMAILTSKGGEVASTNGIQTGNLSRSTEFPLPLFKDQSEKILCTVSRVGSYSDTQLVHQTWRAGKSLITSMLFPAKTSMARGSPRCWGWTRSRSWSRGIGFPDHFGGHFLPLENPSIFQCFFFGALRKREF